MSEAEPAPKTHSQSAPKSASSGGKAIGSIAALLALAAIAAAGYVWTEVQKLQVLPQQMQAGAVQTQQLRSETEQQLTRLAARATVSDATVTELQEVVAGEVVALAELSLSVDQLGEQLDALSGSDRSRRNRFLRAEALYYLRVANARARLASDAEVALTALELADEKLRETGDPEVAAVREVLAGEITALKAIPDIDVTGMAFSLQSLAAQIDTWPLRNPAPQRFSGESPESPPEPAADDAVDTDAWSRFRASVESVFRSIVKVRENTDAPAVQLSQAQHALVIESVRGEVQVARLALVTGEYDLFGQALQRIETQLQSYFDAGDRAVAAALATLTELAAVDRPAAMPDISGSLTLLLDADDAADAATDAQ